MILHELGRDMSPQLKRALGDFESQFQCSLGGGRAFRFTYPAGYVAYLDSLGESCCIAGELDGHIVGMIGGAVLPMRLPNGNVKPLVFIEEVKLVPQLRRTRALWSLLNRCQQWALSQSKFMISVVLDETEIKPSSYTGRAGLLPFRELNRIVVLRIPALGESPRQEDERFLASDERGTDCHRRLTAGRLAVLSRGAEQRSVSPPVWLVHPDGTACARLEDRRKVRQLAVNDGSELRPMFLGCFAFGDARAAVELAQVALRRCAALGYSAVRIAITVQDFQRLREVTAVPPDLTVIPAAVYGTVDGTNAPWVLSGVEV